MEREILFITFSQQGSCQNQIKLRCDNGWRKIRLLFNLKKKKEEEGQKGYDSCIDFYFSNITIVGITASFRAISLILLA